MRNVQWDEIPDQLAAVPAPHTDKARSGVEELEQQYAPVSPPMGPEPDGEGGNKKENKAQKLKARIGRNKQGVGDGGGNPQPAPEPTARRR